MSNLREKAREIKAAGEVERGNFEPHGAPLRAYNYWLENSQGKKASAIRGGYRRENFCHFWRVVVIWTPLLALFRAGKRVVENKAVQIVVGLALLGLFIAAVTAENGWWTLLIGLAIGLGIVAVAAGIVAAGFGIRNLYRKHWNHAWDHTAGTIVLGALAVATALGVIGIFVMLFVDFGWAGPVIALASLAGLALFIYALATLAEFISGRRALAREKARQERDEAFERYLDGEGPNPYERTPRVPGRVDKFFSGLADFLILATQIVRVKKWKICPMVTIDQ